MTTACPLWYAAKHVCSKAGFLLRYTHSDGIVCKQDLFVNLSQCFVWDVTFLFEPKCSDRRRNALALKCAKARRFRNALSSSSFSRRRSHTGMTWSATGTVTRVTGYRYDFQRSDCCIGRHVPGQFGRAILRRTVRMTAFFFSRRHFNTQPVFRLLYTQHLSQR
jgi:hypothetical protein